MQAMTTYVCFIAFGLSVKAGYRYRPQRMCRDRDFISAFDYSAKTNRWHEVCGGARAVSLTKPSFSWISRTVRVGYLPRACFCPGKTCVPAYQPLSGLIYLAEGLCHMAHSVLTSRTPHFSTNIAQPRKDLTWRKCSPSRTQSHR